MYQITQNEKSCIKIIQKRGILYQNHTKTRNFVSQMMNFVLKTMNFGQERDGDGHNGKLRRRERK